MSLVSPSRVSRCRLEYLFAGAIAVATTVAVWPAECVAATSPFQAFVGDWVGGGRIVGSNGDRERIRCRASYSESKHGEALSQTIVCASASYRVDINSYLEASGRSVQGYWREDTRGISGELTGKIEDGRFEGAVNGPGFTAGVSLRSNGQRQAVNIEPSGGDIADVMIELHRPG
jgi:hypothetical protein